MESRLAEVPALTRAFTVSQWMVWIDRKAQGNCVQDAECEVDAAGSPFQANPLGILRIVQIGLGRANERPSRKGKGHERKKHHASVPTDHHCAHYVRKHMAYPV